MLATYLTRLSKPRHLPISSPIFPHKNPIFLAFFYSTESTDLENSFTVRYLVHKCGLTPEIALKAASKGVHLMSPKQPDSVLSFFKNQGLNKAQITQLVSRRPDILKANTERTILPRFNFFLSIGVPPNVLACALASYPELLRLSLSKSLIPSYEYLKGFVGTDARVVYVFKRSVRIFVDGWKRHVPKNIAKLRECNVPETSITFMFAHHPTSLVLGNDQFVKKLNKVIELGFDSSKLVFVIALQALCDLKQSTFERKRKVYSRWGWSESDMDTAFLVHPLCMSLSTTKIDSAMDFLINKMGCQPSVIAKCPMLLFFNLERRIVPRCLVVKALLLKGLRKMKTTHMSGFLIASNDRFMKYYVTKYLEEFPQVLDLYKGKVNINDLGFSTEEVNQVKLH